MSSASVRRLAVPRATGGRAGIGPYLTPPGRSQKEEEREENDKVDRDDEEARERAIGMDEYKDDHRRGEGNRHNMG